MYRQIRPTKRVARNPTSDSESESERELPSEVPVENISQQSAQQDRENEWQEDSDQSPTRETVIYHNSNCCDEPRQRLQGRSMPGRRVDKRHPPVDPFPPKPTVPQRVVQTGDIIKYLAGVLENG